MARSTKYFAKNLALKDAPASALDVVSLGGGRYWVTLDGHRFDSSQLDSGCLRCCSKTNSCSWDGSSAWTSRNTFSP